MARSPDYTLKALEKSTGIKCKVGAGWINRDGSISIALDRFVVLNGNECSSGGNVILVLFLQESPRGETKET